jgi:hypothetical protein
LESGKIRVVRTVNNTKEEAVKIYELIEELQQYDEATEVRLAQQPSWPFEYAIGSVVAAGNGDHLEVTLDEGDWVILNHEAEEEVERHATEAEAHAALRAMKEDDEEVVYIGEGGQVGYLPGDAAKKLSWR